MPSHTLHHAGPPPASTPSSSLPSRLAAVLPKHHTFGIYHLSTPPTKCEPLCPAPPGERPDKTFCERHFLALSIDPTTSPATRESTQPAAAAGSPRGDDQKAGVLVFALEIYIFTTAHSSTFFVSKADSTGYLHLLKLPRGSPSPIRETATAFVSFLVEKRRRRGVQCVVSLFARAQDQYLFPGSIDSGGKHVLDDRGLVRWWCRALSPLVRSPPAGDLLPEWSRVRGYLLVPGLEANEMRAHLPRGAPAEDWVLGHPLELISHYCREHDRVPPRCLVPGFPDDPKARFRDELDEEAGKSAETGSWKSVRSLEQFWDMMEFRQECSSGRLTGFIWVVFDAVEKARMESATNGGPAPGQGVDRPSTPPPGSKENQQAAATAISSHMNLVLSPKPGTTSVTPLTTQSSSLEPEKEAEKKKRKKKKKKTTTLTGRIRPRQPHVKTHARTAAFSDRIPSTCAYYHWPAEGRGERLVDEQGYHRVMDLLLRLDFSNLELAVASTRRWAGEVDMGSGWGVNVVGARELSEAENEAPVAGRVNDLAGQVKRKRDGEEIKVNVLGGGLRKISPTSEASSPKAVAVVTAPPSAELQHLVHRSLSSDARVLLSSNGPLPVTRHIDLPFDLRSNPDAFYDRENRDLLSGLFTGNYGLSMDGYFLIFLQNEIPPRPWPKTVAGLPPYFATEMGADQHPRLRGTPVPMKNGSIAREMDGRNINDWTPLFAVVRDHFQAIGVSITEVMHWNDYVLIVLEHREVDVSKLPCEAAKLRCMYLFDDEMGRPPIPQAHSPGDPAAPGNLDNSVYDVLQPGLGIASPYSPTRPGMFLPTTTGVLAKDEHSNEFMTAAARGFPANPGPAVLHPLPVGGRKIGARATDLTHTGIALVKLEDQEKFFNVTFQSEDVSESIQLTRLARYKHTKIGHTVLLDSPDTGCLKGMLMATSFQRVPTGDLVVPEQRWVFTNWYYMGQDSAGALPGGARGSAVWTGEGDVVGVFCHAPTEGAMRDWCTGVGADELIRRGYTLVDTSDRKTG